MENSAFEMFIQVCGSVKQAAKVLGLKREHVSAMRQGRIEVGLLNAVAIERYIRQHTDKTIHHSDLISPCVKHQLKRLGVNFFLPTIELVRISIDKVQYSPTTAADQTANAPPDFNRLRPILIDENHQLISNSVTYLVYQKHKKTVPAWRFSLVNLLAGQYRSEELAFMLLLCERAALGIALKKYIGNRQGKRSDLKHCRNFSTVKGRTDELLASLLGFSSKDSYRQAETIQLFGSSELIQRVNDKKIALSTAVVLSKLPFAEQIRSLSLCRKTIIALATHLKKGINNTFLPHYSKEASL